MRFRFLLILIFLPLSLCAQGEANNWYFGVHAGLNFNNTPPTPVLDGELNTSEGCSTISDANGNLLFYTDGRTVWNRNHNIMPNADYFNGSGLLGDPSSTSSGLIVPYPNNPDLYYIFTVDEPHHDNAAAYPDQGPAEQDGSPTPDGHYTDIPTHSIPEDDDGYNNGFNYSVVDMSRNNGLGDVDPFEKNVELRTYDPTDSAQVRYKCAEKITAVKGDQCNSIWVITHFVDKFYAFKIDETGLDTVPVVSTVGPAVSTDDYRRAALGYLKASPEGDNLLIAHNTRGYNQIGVDDQQTGGIWLYDFDPVTGAVSGNQKLVDSVNAYGVEFSQNSSKAYGSTTKNGRLEILQWDLTSNDIPDSKTSIETKNGGAATALQLAPNGKIYTPGLSSTKLNVINSPNATGTACDYSEDTSNGAIEMGTIVNYGLPPFIQSFFANRVNIVNNAETIETNVNLCDGESFTLGRPGYSGASYTWIREGDTLMSESSNTLEISQPDSAELPYDETYRLFIDRNNGDCIYKGVAHITYFPYPKTTSDTLVNCGVSTEEPGSIFDFSQAELFIGENAEHIQIAYFDSQSDAETDTDVITDSTNHQSLSAQTTVIAKVTDTLSNCSSYTSLVLETSDALDLDAIDLNICSDATAAISVFDLSPAREEIQNATATEYTVEFYESSEDALLEQNPILDENAFESNGQSIYAAVTNDNACYAIVPVNLIINDAIDLPDDEKVFYCVNDFPEPIRLNSGIPENETDKYTYEWTPSGKTAPSIETNDTITHSVEVTQKATGCTASREIAVSASGKAQFSIDKEDFAFDQNTIRVIVDENSIGDYVYALDDTAPGSFQEDSLFTGVAPGQHQVYVKDLNGCGIVQQEVILLSVMKFFTPNDDGVNDRWRLIGWDQGDLKAIKVYIYTRYGKLLKVFKGNFRGWDGTYQGKEMPSNDYWYKVKTGDGRLFRGHFTLKR